MLADDRPTTAGDPESSVGDLLTYAALLQSPRLAQLYVYVLREGAATIDAVKDDLDLPHSTAYKYVGELEEMGVLTRHDESRPTTLTVEPSRLVIETEHGEVVATPVLVDAIARQRTNEDVRVFVERHGIPKLAAAVHYAQRVSNGELTQRTAAAELDVHPAEGMMVLTALQNVVEDARAYDPFLDYQTE